MAAALQKKLKQWHAWEKKRLAAAAVARDVGKLQGELEKELFAYTKAEGGKARCVVAHGFRLLLSDERKSVSWKGEFVKEHGEAAAVALAEAQTTKEVLVVEPPKS